MHKKEIDLPRRCSKRLAGIRVDDPVPDLKVKARNQAHQPPVKQPGEEETIITNTDKSTNSLLNCPAKQFNAPEEGSELKCKSDNIEKRIELPKLTTPEKHPVKNLEVHRSDKDKECFSSVSVPENGDKVDAKLDYDPDFPLKEILSDPCIAFAIQTLTETTFETFKDPSEVKNSQHSETSSAAAAAAERHGKKISVPADDLERCNVLPSPENFTIPQEHAGVSKNDHKTNENAGSSSEKTIGISSLMDPCIEFAIKTLTGTIPIDPGQNPKSCIQQ